MAKRVIAANEALRQRYRPAPIRVLFVGESPPAGGTFFYAANSNLSRYTQAAFERAYGRTWGSGAAFLRFFQQQGCFLEDLCLAPVNHETAAARRRLWRAWVPSLAERIARAQPLALVSVMTATWRAVEQAIARAGVAPQRVAFLPFPTFGNQPRYVARLSELLQTLRAEGILQDAPAA